MHSEDISMSIDIITKHVDSAIDAVQSLDSTTSSKESALRHCYQAEGLLTTLLQFKYFQAYPHDVLNTCADALWAVNSVLQKCWNQERGHQQHEDHSQQTEAEKTKKLSTQLSSRGYFGRVLDEIIGNEVTIIRIEPPYFSYYYLMYRPRSQHCMRILCYL